MTEDRKPESEDQKESGTSTADQAAEETQARTADDDAENPKAQDPPKEENPNAEESLQAENNSPDDSTPTQNDSSADGDAPAQTDSATDDFKVILSVRNGITTIGVQRPACDPQIESFAHMEIPEAALQITDVVERARAKWESEPQYPAHAAPVQQPAPQTRTTPAQTTPAPAAEEEAKQKQATLF